MPTVRINFIPENIPGLQFNQTDSEGGTVSGSIDALCVVGVPSVHSVPGYDDTINSSVPFSDSRKRESKRLPTT